MTVDHQQHSRAVSSSSSDSGVRRPERATALERLQAWAVGGSVIAYSVGGVGLVLLVVQLGAAMPAWAPLLAGRPWRRLQSTTKQLGCFHYNYGYTPLSEEAQISTFQPHAVACQAYCASISPRCNFFTFWKTWDRCDVALPGAGLAPSEESNPGVSGPAVCSDLPESPVCSDLPNQTLFPGPTVAESEAAWPHSEVPTNAQCWPREANSGDPVACTSAEQNGTNSVTVLEDFAEGWPALCTNLEMTAVPAGSTCQEFCYQNVLCSVWVEVSSECWTGKFGDACYGPRLGFTPTGGERIMHGTYRVLKDLKGLYIEGLTQMFTADVDRFNDVDIAAAHCRFYCIAHLGCQYWIYSSLSGCWAEDPSKTRVAWPLTTNKRISSTSSQSAAAIVAGEYIQHYCGGERPSAAPAGVKVAKEAALGMKPEPSAHIVAPAAAGTMRLVVQTQQQFELGKLVKVTLASPPQSEVHKIVGLNPITIDSPLRSSYPVGAKIIQMEMTTTTSAIAPVFPVSTSAAVILSPEETASNGETPPYLSALMAFFAILVCAGLAGGMMLALRRRRQKRYSETSIMSFDDDSPYRTGSEEYDNEYSPAGMKDPESQPMLGHGDY